MPRLSLTDFVDIVAATGPSKITKVLALKKREKYEPKLDFWKALREKIVEVHRNDLPKAALDEVLRDLRDEKKMRNYPVVLAAYKKWWGRKDLRWFDPPSKIFSHEGIDLSVNPELGLEIAGRPHLLKLYFKSEALSKAKVSFAVALMEMSLRRKAPEAVMAVLDVRRSRICSAPANQRNARAGVLGELAYISALWQQTD